MQRQAAPAVSNNPADLIEKYARLSIKSDAIKSSRATYVKEIATSLRAAVAPLPFEQAVEATSRFDGLICLPALVASVNAIRADYEQQFLSKYGLNMAGAAEQMENEFETYLDTIIAQIIKKKRGNVTQKEIDDKAAKIINDYWQKAVKANSSLKGKQPDAEFSRLIKNYAFAVSASKVYRDTDDMQMLDFDNLTAFNILSKGPLVIRIWRMTKEKMIESYQGLDRFANQLSLTDAEKQQWSEVAVWLSGLYNRVYRCIPADRIDAAGEVKLDSKGNYPTVDSADKLFLAHKGVTKYFMSLFNRALAHKLALMTGMRTENNVVSCAASAAVTVPSTAAAAAAAAATTSSTVVPVSNVGANSSAPLPQSDVVHCEPLSDGRSGWRLTVEIPDCDKDRKDNIIAVIEDFYDEETLSKWLKQCENATAEDKINRLDYCINYFSLSQHQNERLFFIPNTVKNKFKNYRNGNFFLSRTHAERSLNAVDQIESAQSPKDQLIILLELRNQLVALHSVALKKEVDEILISAFNQLVIPEPRSSASAAIPKSGLTYEMIGGTDKGARISVVVTDEILRNKMITELTEHINQSPKQHDLPQWELINPDDKIKRLDLYIKHNELNSHQIGSLKFLLPAVQSQFQAYRSSKGFMGMFLPLVTHAEKSSVAEDKIAEAQSPKEQLAILLELRDELIGDNSDHLLKAVNSILLSAYNALVMSPDVKPLAAAAAAVRM